MAAASRSAPTGCSTSPPARPARRRGRRTPTRSAARSSASRPRAAPPPTTPSPGRRYTRSATATRRGWPGTPGTGDLFASEHGPSGEFGLRAHDEVNVIVPGGNYGWPAAVGAPDLEPYADPLVAWKESAVPPAGMAFHHGALFVATLGRGALVRIDLARDGARYRVRRIERWFAEGPGSSVLGRLRAAVVGPDDRLYLLTSNRDGRGDPRPGDDTIYRLEPTG